MSTATPTLSKKQQKSALSSKKCPKVTIKHILGNPYTSYFPLLNDNDYDLLKNKLNDTFSRLVAEKYNVPWKALMNVSRTERKQFRSEYKDEYKSADQVPVDLDLKLHLLFGINTVTKGLENNEVLSVLVNADASPQLIIKHVLNMCVIKNIPVLVVPKLSDLLKHSTGIKSMTVAIKNTVKLNTKLFILNNFITEMSQNYPVPENHAHYNAESMDCANVEPEESLDENMQNLYLKKDNILNSESKPKYENHNVETKHSKPKDFEQSNKHSSNLHLIRSTRRNRAFVPEISELLVQGNQVDSKDYLGLGDIQKKVIHKKTPNYNHLKVKRIRNNKNRPKKQKVK